MNDPPLSQSDATGSLLNTKERHISCAVISSSELWLYDRQQEVKLHREKERSTSGGETHMSKAVGLTFLSTLLLLASVAFGQEVLPQPEQPFKGKIGRTAKDSTR